MTHKLEKNTHTFSKAALSTSDVLLTPSQGVLKSRKDADVSSTFIYNSPMDTVASPELGISLLTHNQAYVTNRFDSDPQKINALDSFVGEPGFWFSVGVSDSDYDLIDSWWYKHCLKTNENPKINICVDVAHGDTKHLLSVYTKYREAPWSAHLMSGTVATPASAHNVVKAGCSHVRVGIGPGSACSTRIVTGCGVPNLTAVFNIWCHFNITNVSEKPPTIIADGGIKTSGDIAKYLSAGADAVMLGNLLSKTYESAGWSVNPFYNALGSLFSSTNLLFKARTKRYRGQASRAFQLQKRGAVSGAPEGVQGGVINPTCYSVDFLNQIYSSLSSTLSYLGLKSLLDLSPSTVEFIRITQGGLRESHPHIND